MTKRRRWILLPLVALAAVLSVLVILFDWNWLKGLVEDQASAALGRDVEIAGGLDVELGFQPRIIIEDARLANAPWASDVPMIAAARMETVIDLPALLQGRIELPEVSVTGPAVSLETRPDGPSNWQLGPLSERPPTIPRIGQLQVHDASFRYYDHGSGRAIAASLTEVSGSTDRPDGGMALTAVGEVEGEPLDLKLTGAPLAQLQNAAEPYPLSLDLKLGGSDVTGDMKLDLGGDVPAVSADLSSKQVKSAELTRLIGAGDAAFDGAPPQAAPDGAREQARSKTNKERIGRAGPKWGAWLRFEELPPATIDLHYTIGRLDGPNLILQDVSLQAGLRDRLPTLALEGGGTLRGETVILDVKASPAEGAARPQVSYRIDAEIEAGQTRLTASGGIDQPEHLQGADLEFEARSPDTTELLRQLGVEVPELPGLQASGRFIREGEVWRLTGLDAQIGDSDLSGQLSATLSGPRPFISADLRSRRLLAEDLMPGPEAGQGAEAAAEETAKGRPDPITPSGVNFDALPEVDASVHFHGDYVKVPEVVFQQLELDLELRDRVAVVDATGDGTFRQFKPVAFEVHAGTEDSLENPEARYPLDLVLQAGDTVARAEGTVDRPLNYTGLDLDVDLRGSDLQMLGTALQLPLPATPPYRLTGKLTHQDEYERWNLVAVRGTVGGSDLTGDVSLELDAARPTIVAKLQSNTLDFDDFGVAVGAPPDTQPGETASPRQAHQAAQGTANGRVLPDKKFRIPELRAFNARVSFTGDSIQARTLPLQELTLELTLDDGVITVRPLRVDLAGGELQAAAQVDGREDVLAGRFEVAVRQISINELLSRFDIEVADIEKEGVGVLSGRATLETRGNSFREMAAGADSQLLLIMDGGRINELILEAVGLDIGEAIVLLFNGEDEDWESEMVPVQCFVGQFETRDGVMQTDALVLETSDSTITGKGEADLGKETIALELLAHPKDASALAASTPVRIEGTFKAPKTGLVSEELQEKSLAALALGVVLPVIGAVLPFIEQGETEGINCQRLIRNAQAAMPDAPAMDESR
jgi:uncharacterized protein involved in outer membrane biogenesis